MMKLVCLVAFVACASAANLRQASELDQFRASIDEVMMGEFNCSGHAREVVYVWCVCT